MKKIKGTAHGAMRYDSRAYDIEAKMKKATEAGMKSAAAAARQEMIDREQALHGESLTDKVVKEIGGASAAAKQAKAYEREFENIKKGKHKHKGGTAAEQARSRMIERQEHPDVGHDKANRKAYPKK